MRLTFILFIALVSLIACDKNDLIEIQGLKELQMNNCNELILNKVFINSQEEYLNLQTAIRRSNCCNDLVFPEIDLIEYTLLGIKTLRTACAVNYQRKVFFNASEQHYLYSLTTEKIGSCEEEYDELNWILVPKIENNAKVLFQVIQN